jgi:hypothetical protein
VLAAREPGVEIFLKSYGRRFRDAECVEAFAARALLERR